MSHDQNTHKSEPVRLDKWLWAARFFKTRGLAAEAIKGGKVHVNGARGKPSRQVQLGDELQITRGETHQTVHVTALSVRRGPASEAARLYEESAESISRRDQEQEARRALKAMVQIDRRPNKKDRRRIINFKKQHS